MARERPVLTLARGLALLSVLLLVAALVVFGFVHIFGVTPRGAGTIGWLALLGGVLSGVAAVTRGYLLPLRRIEERAFELAAGDGLESDTDEFEERVGPILEAFRAIARRLALLTDIAELLAGASDRSAVLAGITSAMMHIPESSDAAVLLLVDDDTLELAAAEGSLASRIGATYRLDELPWARRAMSGGVAVLAQKESASSLLGSDGDGTVSVLASPMRAGDVSMGIVVLLRPRGAFTEAESDAMRSFAAQAAVALRNSQLFEEERRSRYEAEWLREVAERAATAGTPDETLGEIARMQAELFGFSEWRVVLHDRSSLGLPPEHGDATGREWKAAWRAAGGQVPEATAVYLRHGTAPPTAKAALENLKASGVLLTPLYRGGALEGFLVLLGGPDTPEPGASALAVAATVGRQASLVLENAYLYQQAKSRADNLETIFRISHAVGSSLQSRVVLNRVLDVVQKILFADAVMLMRYDTQRKLIVSPMARGTVSSEMLAAAFRPGEDVPGRVFETHEPERYADISGSDTWLLNRAAAQGLESLLAVPLLARGRSIGVLLVLSRKPGAFSSDELDLLRTFASQAALAIDNADLFSREHETVHVLQQSIMPVRLPEIPSLDAASIYLPGGADAEIGGDYYDLFACGEGRVVLSIGDVCGKGVHAATKTSMIRHALRGMIVAGLEPARVLAELNAMLVELDDPANNIVTLWLGVLDLASRELTYANAGHPAGLVLQHDRSIQRLPTTGALLGAVPTATWLQEKVLLDAGSLLLLYTDGVTEARRGSKFFGEGRVRRALRMGGSAEELAQRLLAHVQNHCGGEIRDDVAILAVRHL